MMARFLQFQNVNGKTVWINPDCVVGVTQSHIDEHTVAIVGADGENPWFVPGTVAEVMAKLQGDPEPEPEPEQEQEPAKDGDDMAGWWFENVTGRAIYVIGQDSNGSLVYQMEGRLLLRSRSGVIRRHYFRDPNRKGWEE